MFFRTVKAPCGAGEERVESYWEDGKTKQRIVCNLGRKDVLAAHLDGLVRLIAHFGHRDRSDRSIVITQIAS